MRRLRPAASRGRAARAPDHLRRRPPGHDRRYAIDCTKAERELGWAPCKTFEAALEETVAWYLANEAWWRPIREGRYKGDRLGLAAGQAH